MKKIIVLAGTREEFEKYLDDNGLTDSEAVYGYRAENILGVQASKVVTIGTFGKRDNQWELYDLANSRIY